MGDEPDIKSEGPWSRAWKRLRKNRMAMAGLVVVFVMAGAAILAPWVVPFDPRESERWATALEPGDSHLELRNEIVLTQGARPRDTDVPPHVTDVLADGEEHLYRVEVAVEKMRLLRLTMEGAVVQSIGEGGARHTRIELGPGDGLVAKENAKPLPMRTITAGESLPPEVAVKDGRWVLMVEWRQRAEAGRQVYEARIGADGVVSALTLDGKPSAGELRIRAENVEDASLDGVRRTHKHLLGTDLSGRDVLSRVIYGGRISLLVGLVATLVSLTIGVLYGATSAFLGGRADAILMRAVDVLYALPYIFLVIVLLTVFDRSIVMLFVALGLVQWLTPARVVRGQVLSIKRREFVDAAVTLGTSRTKILLRHLIPNTLGIVVVFTTLTIPAVILEESFLSFIGLTVMYDGEPLDSWGALVENGRNALGTNGERWWLLVCPAAAMSITLFSLNFLGDGLRDALDPQQRGKK